MSKSYLLYRCAGAGFRTPLAVFTADCEEEAREAPTWLKRQHPENARLRLGPGEFYEVVEQGQCPPEDWEEAQNLLRGGQSVFTDRA